MNARRLFTVAGIALATLSIAPAHADPRDDGRGCHERHHAMGMQPMGQGLAERLADRVDLTPAQVTALRNIEDKFRPQWRDVRDRMQESRRALASADPADEAGVRRIADARGKAIADMIVLRTQMRAQVRNVLTEEQRNRLREMVRHHRMHGGMSDRAMSDHGMSDHEDAPVAAKPGPHAGEDAAPRN